MGKNGKTRGIWQGFSYFPFSFPKFPKGKYSGKIAKALSIKGYSGLISQFPNFTAFLTVLFFIAYKKGDFMTKQKLYKQDISICRFFGYRVEVQPQKTGYAVYVLEQYQQTDNPPFGSGVMVGLAERYVSLELDKHRDYLAGFFQGLCTANALMRTHYYSLGLRPHITKIRTLDTANHVAKILTDILRECVKDGSNAYHEKLKDKMTANN